MRRPYKISAWLVWRPGANDGPRAVLIVCSSRSENTSAKISTNSARAWCVVGGDEALLPRRSSAQVMSIPTWGMEGRGVEEGMGCEKTAFGGEVDGGKVVPASATSDAWWLTLNSMLGMAIAILWPWLFGLGMKHGRRCGAGVRLIWISGHGTRHVRWMKRYLSR